MSINDEQLLDRICHSSWRVAYHTMMICYSIIGFCAFWIWLKEPNQSSRTMYLLVIGALHIFFFIFLPLVNILLVKLMSLVDKQYLHIQKHYKDDQQI